MSRDKLLFTPGPLTTSRSVKEAMLRDIGSRDAEFVEVVREIRQELLALGNVSKQAGHESVLLPGSGTFGVESVLGCIPETGKLLVIVNGAYGERMAKIAERLRIPVHVLRYPEDAVPELDEIAAAISADEKITHVGVVHCETTAGILNPIEKIGAIVRKHQKKFIVDAMSSFGGVPTDCGGIDFLVSSANKCIEGVPGFSFVIARRESLLEGESCARSVSLDLPAQWRELESSGQFRFTPPTHALLAFARALRELDDEGGVARRSERYAANHKTLISGMRALGFREVVRPELQSYIITAFFYLENPAFRFEEFYTRLAHKGFLLYPGKLGRSESFRIGTIGRIFPEHVEQLLNAIQQTLEEIKCLQPAKTSDSSTAT